MAVDIIRCETQPLTVLATVRSSGGAPAMSKAGEAWIDVSVTVRHGVAHWPGNPPIVVERSIDIGRGDDCNLSRLAMGVHSDTHNEGWQVVPQHGPDHVLARSAPRPVALGASGCERNQRP